MKFSIFGMQGSGYRAAIFNVECLRDVKVEDSVLFEEGGVLCLSSFGGV